MKTKTNTRPETSNALRHPGVLADSYLLQLGDFPNITGNSVFTEVIAEDHHLLLEGAFYLRESKTFDPEQNLKSFQVIMDRHGLAVARQQIAGGFFNLFILDHARGHLTVLNDRLGLLPLYYREGHGSLLLSNNQFNFLADNRLSEIATREFLKYGYLPVSPSFLEGVERLGPNTLLEIKLDPLSLESTSDALPEYPDVPQSGSPNDLADEWAAAFKTYFDRLDSNDIMLGLSGGYDSRLIAAHVASRQPQLLNFGDADSAETRIAGRVAASLGIPLLNDQFPADAMARYGRRAVNEFRVPTSLENAHVLHLSQRVREGQPRHYLDGFLGGAVFADAYTGKRDRSLSGILKELFGFQSDANAKLGALDYATILSQQDKQALPDNLLDRYLDEASRKALEHAFERFSRQWIPGCSSHEDTLERLRLLTRGRNLIANGPVALQSHSQVLLPFMDYRILELSQHTAKHPRARHALYNTLFRRHFKRLARIRKAGTFGKATDTAFMYRFKSLAYMIYKHSIKPHLEKWFTQSSQREEQYFSLSTYLSEPKTRRLIKRLMEQDHPHIPSGIQDRIRADYRAGQLDPVLLTRHVSLILFLAGGQTKENA